MAIFWNPERDPNGFIFGGDIDVTTNSTDPATLGIPGPQPRYNISREVVQKDTLFLRNKYTITVDGIGLINQTASMLVAGERQNRIHDIIKQLTFQSGKTGKLEITPYGGLPNILVFDDATLLNAEVSEQDETSQGVQNQNYSLTFEAYELTINNDSYQDDQLQTIDSDIGGTTENPIKFRIKDFSESWDWNVTEEYDFTGTDMNVDDPDTRTIDRTFLISHTVSATGYSRPEVVAEGAPKPQNNAAYIEARNFITYWLQNLREGTNYTPPPYVPGDYASADRPADTSSPPPGDTPSERQHAIYNDPFSPATDSVVDHSTPTPIAIKLQGDTIDPDNLARGYFAGIYNEDLTEDPHRAWDQTNTYTQDILEGTYSVTRTWKVSKYPSIVNVEFDVNQDITADANVISVNVSIAGRETFDYPDRTDEQLITERNLVDKVKSDKYRNAKERSRFFLGNALTTIVENFYNVLYPVAGRPDNGGNIKGIKQFPTSLSQTHNQTNGTINISATYSDTLVPNPASWGNIMDETVTVTDSNTDGLNEVVAILPVIAKKSGPIIQNMATTPERTRSVSLEWKMAPNTTAYPNNRKQKPRGLQYIQEFYKPQTTANWQMPDGQQGTTPPVYRQNATETWNWRTGVYSASADYVWTDGSIDDTPIGGNSNVERRVPLPAPGNDYTGAGGTSPLSNPPDDPQNYPDP